MNFELVLKILLQGINDNLKHKIFEVEHLINLYIQLIDEFFKKASLGYGYNHPRVIVKLVYLGLFLCKYKMDEQEKNLKRIENL